MEHYVNISKIESYGVDIHVTSDTEQCQVRKQLTFTDFEYRTVLTMSVN